MAFTTMCAGVKTGTKRAVAVRLYARPVKRNRNSGNLRLSGLTNCCRLMQWLESSETNNEHAHRR
jgi:hypothetical protein